MTYTLKFEPWTAQDTESVGLFTTVYVSFLGRQDNPNRAKSLEETRTAIRVLDAFEAVTTLEVNGEGENKQEHRQLRQEGGEVVLGDAEFRLLQQAVDAYVATVPFSLARLAVKVKDFVDNAPKA